MKHAKKKKHTNTSSQTLYIIAMYINQDLQIMNYNLAKVIVGFVINELNVLLCTQISSTKLCHAFSQIEHTWFYEHLYTISISV